jgi:predicted HTH domain antitoxin
MKRVEINLPDETFAGLDRESAELAAEFRAAAAAKWYEVGRVSQELATQIAGVSRTEFLTVLTDFRSLQCRRVPRKPSRARAYYSSPETGGAQRIGLVLHHTSGLSRSGPEARLGAVVPRAVATEVVADRRPQSMRTLRILVGYLLIILIILVATGFCSLMYGPCARFPGARGS